MDQVVVHLVFDVHQVPTVVVEHSGYQQQVQTLEIALEDCPLDAVHLVRVLLVVLGLVLLVLVHVPLVDGVVQTLHVIKVLLQLAE